MVVRGGNGRLGRVAAMLRKWNRPVITLMNRAVSVPLRGFRGLQDCKEYNPNNPYMIRFQSPCGVLGVCRVKRCRQS